MIDLSQPDIFDPYYGTKGKKKNIKTKLRDFLQHSNRNEKREWLNEYSSNLSFLADFNFNGVKTLQNVANSRVGKLFFKDAQQITKVLPNKGGTKFINGIAQSGKSLRTAPFLLAGGVGLGYGGYKVKKKYDQYKPEIRTGLRLAKLYNSFKDRFSQNG